MFFEQIKKFQHLKSSTGQGPQQGPQKTCHKHVLKLVNFLSKISKYLTWLIRGHIVPWSVMPCGQFAIQGAFVLWFCTHVRSLMREVPWSRNLTGWQYKILDRGERGGPKIFFSCNWSSGSILTILAPQIFVVSFIEAIYHLVTIIITPSHFVKMFIFSPTRKFLVLIWSELNH